MSWLKAWFSGEGKYVLILFFILVLTKPSADSFTEHIRGELLFGISQPADAGQTVIDQIARTGCRLAPNECIELLLSQATGGTSNVLIMRIGKIAWLNGAEHLYIGALGNWWSLE